MQSSPSLQSSASSSHRKTNSDRATPTNRTHRPSKTTSSQQASSSGGLSVNSRPSGSSNPAKGKKKINPTPSSAQKTSATSSASKPSKNPSTTAQSSNSASPHTSSSHAPRHPKPPVNFQELMKLAENRVVTNSVKGGDPPEQKDKIGSVSRKNMSKVGKNALENSGRGSREGSPLGKQLLEKSRSKHRKVVSSCEDSVSGERKRGNSGLQECTGSSQRPHEAASDRSSVGNNVRELAQSRVVGRGTKTGTSNGGEKTSAVCSVGKSQRLPESAILMRERFRRELEASANTARAGGSNTHKQSVKSNSFYGAAHSQLSQEGRPKFPSKRPPPGPYQSSWVREMSEYMEQMRGEEEGYSEEEEEEDLDGFVVDDEDGDDVSLAIREIFGYDKRK